MDGYRFFDVAVLERTVLSPTLRRFVLAGDGVGAIRRPAPDLYLKIFFPTAGAGLDQLPRDDAWYQRWLAKPAEARVAMRTFTVRALDARRGTLVVDFALHGDLGPASHWAGRADIGDALVIYAPLAARWGRGYTWRLPKGARRVLLVGDECALPAVAGILETVAEQAPDIDLTAVLEVPQAGDVLPLKCGRGSVVHWRPRGAAAYGVLLQAGAAAWLGQSGAAWPETQLADGEPLWELAGESGPSYVWIAAETGVAGSLRRMLIEAGMTRESVSCMGYWRQGRAQV